MCQRRTKYRPITTTWPLVNYLGRIQQVEIRTQATNKTTAQLLYVHRRVGKTIKQRTTTSISDASTLSTQL